MAPATVDNLRNYRITYTLPSQFDPLEYTTVGVLEQEAIPAQKVSFRAAKYDAATDTVTLLTKGTPGTNGTYRISSPPSLAAKLPRPHKAHALTDTEGNPVFQTGATVPGYFEISISRGHPYDVAAPTFSDGD